MCCFAARGRFAFTPGERPPGPPGPPGPPVRASPANHAVASWKPVCGLDAWGWGIIFFVLIQAALNGGTTRAEHPGVPLTAAELAAEGRAAAEQGAQALHLHPRDAAGEQTLDPEHVLAAVAATRAATGLPVGVTTGIWTVNGDVARRLDLVARWTGPDRPDYASINMNEPGTEDLADLLTSLGIQIEAGVWTAADARLLGAAAFKDRILRVLMEPVDRNPAGAAEAAAEAAAELARLGVTARQVHHGYDLATWDVISAAVAMGQDIRVGLEDTQILPDGSPAAGNADLVAAAARLVREP
ncbi:MAG TPA: 3-keto-5-aminohexanoate cleavage protein [Trebonia sp.]|nr:3-keto-5-aminohexanoate cleavage protein [Trebonia sp.]